MDGVRRLREIKLNLILISDPEFMESKAVEFLRSLKTVMEDMNSDQLMKGLQPNGSSISPEYRDEGYAEFKRRINPNSIRSKYTPNLNLKGDFHKSIEVVFDKSEFRFVSNDVKADRLLAKYGSVLGLSEENKAIILEELRMIISVFIKRTLLK